MDHETELTSDWLTLHSMPELAAAIRERKSAILRRWEHAVQKTLPDADHLTRQQVRDTIPVILDQFAVALASDKAPASDDFFTITKAHGITRFHESYNVRELIAEYRLLRGIVLEEMNDVMSGKLTFRQILALDAGIDIALQQAVVAFVGFQQDEIKAVTESQSKYLSFLSHDLRNNLNGVMLTMEVLSRSLATLPQFKEDVDEIKGLQRAMTETVGGMDRLLQAERLRKRTGKIDFTPVPLAEVVSDVVRQMSRAAHGKNLEIRSAVPESAVVSGDRELITLVLQNIMGNAVKYSHQGLVRIAAEPSSGIGPAEWLISIADQGPGIPAEHLGNLFDAFARGATYGQPGVGLGLAIASQAAKAMSAEVTVESHVGRGTTFRIKLTAHVTE